MRISLGCDHGAFKMKEQVKEYLKELGHEVVDFGTNSTERCDYTDYAFLVAMAVSTGKCNVGIMLDTVGTGSTMVCNKLPGVRAALCNEIFTARNSRQHNGANVLCMGSFIVGEGVWKEIIKVWLETELSGERNVRRVGEIVKLENRLFGIVK